MRFFDRTEEIASLKEILELSKSNAQFTVVTGRRRIGKTSLVWKAYENEPILYFFVARKAESDLCTDYIQEIENKLGIPTMGRVERFPEIFEYLMKLSIERPITLFIDEFQEFFKVNKSVYSDMQRIWDMYHQDTSPLLSCLQSCIPKGSVEEVALSGHRRSPARQWVLLGHIYITKGDHSKNSTLNKESLF